MLSEEFKESFSGVVPLFPLPKTVFFPGTRLPLRIFEERYQRMLHDVRKKEQLICIVLLDGSENRIPISDGVPAKIHNMGCLGRLTQVGKRPSGLFDIELLGLCRAMIKSELPVAEPYRLAKVEPLSDSMVQLSASEKNEVLQRAFDALNRVLRKYSSFPAEFLTRFKELPLGILLDIIAHHAPCGVQKKQLFLQETEPLRRCDKIVEVLDKISQGPGPEKKIRSASLFPLPSKN